MHASLVSPVRIVAPQPQLVFHSQLGGHRLKPGKLKQFLQTNKEAIREKQTVQEEEISYSFFQEVQMHLSEVIWWIYTALIVLAAIFFLVFAFLVKEKGK